MATGGAEGALDPVTAIALVGALGVGSQWLAWKLRMPAIVLMLVAGIVAGPILGVFDPARDIGPLYAPMISIAVAIILFEGGLTLNFHTLRDAAEGVKRLVFIGAPLGWLLSTLALRYGAGTSWESAAVFGGIMIVTGPTVIAPLLRSARLARRPGALLQWEAILNDPIGALAAVLAFEVVLVLRTAEQVGEAAWSLILGLVVACVLGAAGGYGTVWAFKRAKVPEFMKVPALFVAILAVFAASNLVLHESGLLAVTLMGIVIANADLPSFEEMRRFKEHATILLVSGVFILLAASLDFAALSQLTWRAGIFVVLVLSIARPVTVFAALAWTKLPWKEQVLVAFTGPRGVVLIAVAGLFGERLVELGVEDGALIGPLAFILVAASVVVHGFTLKPFARFLGLVASETPGVILVGGSNWTTGLAQALKKADIPVLVTDPNRGHLRRAREAGLETFFGDILSEGAEMRIELNGYKLVVAATDNDAYNTLVATDLGPHFGRENVYQIAREKAGTARHSLPATLGGRKFAGEATYNELNRLMWNDWTFRVTGLTEEYTMEDWRAKRPEARLLAWIDESGEIHFVSEDDEVSTAPGVRLVSMLPPEEAERGQDAA
ncbi:sodium/proton antiporter, CPA1 family (TC 2.A.36) [Palleronia salina]|uniref:Sodium/proton antiporter, CPA1 family (TC 2.A.36) n=1 Tax=Palleronia salina TaxID=313368 RepID=A0A1M6A7N0_9RHOB|nr:sodium:proton antiporter [Palleronia salina]SHI32482.1 sodium/proton antiporter, CPA1 family (TC 2.A.36) [Palleronia salina]